MEKVNVTADYIVAKVTTDHIPVKHSQWTILLKPRFKHAYFIITEIQLLRTKL